MKPIQGFESFWIRATISALVKKIMNQEVDLGFVLCRPDEKRFKVKILGTTEVVLLAAKASKHLPADEISITQLPELPLIVHEAGSGLREVIFEYLKRYKVTPNLAMESGSVAFIKAFVRADYGLAFLERYSVREELEAGVLKPIRILEGSPSFRLGIGYFQRKDLSPTAWGVSSHCR